jgi:hypothetical protein
MVLLNPDGSSQTSRHGVVDAGYYHDFSQTFAIKVLERQGHAFANIAWSDATACCDGDGLGVDVHITIELTDWHVQLVKLRKSLGLGMWTMLNMLPCTCVKDIAKSFSSRYREPPGDEEIYQASFMSALTRLLYHLLAANSTFIVLALLTGRTIFYEIAA